MGVSPSLVLGFIPLNDWALHGVSHGCFTTHMTGTRFLRSIVADVADAVLRTINIINSGCLMTHNRNIHIIFLIIEIFIWYFYFNFFSDPRTSSWILMVKIHLTPWKSTCNSGYNILYSKIYRTSTIDWISIAWTRWRWRHWIHWQLKLFAEISLLNLKML